MQHSDAPRKELARAESAFVAMRDADDVRSRHEHWLLFLSALDRIWNKAEAHFRKSPKWPNWHGRFKAQRTKDPLLRYLAQARNADEHQADPVAEPVLGSVSVNAIDRLKPVKIKELRIDDKGRVSMAGAENARIDFRQPIVKIKPVENRGAKFEIPTEHLGKAIEPTDVVAIADLALDWYRAFLKAAEDAFVTTR